MSDSKLTINVERCPEHVHLQIISDENEVDIDITLFPDAAENLAEMLRKQAAMVRAVGSYQGTA